MIAPVAAFCHLDRGSSKGAVPAQRQAQGSRARHALSHLLDNWRKHGEDQQGLASTWRVDPFSSGILFPDWQELEDKAVMWPIRETYDPVVVYRPRSWLLREGWKIHGLIGTHEIPSQRH